MLGRYNLWRGWSCEASEGDVGLGWISLRTSWPTATLTTRTTSLRGARRWSALSSWVWPWCYAAVRAVGRDQIWRATGGLCKPHHKIVARSEHVTGHFNRHLEDTLLLQADEAFWPELGAARAHPRT